jgi:PAS domain S-box-containing protein
MNILASGQGKTCEYRALTINGEKSPIEVTITLVRDESEESIGFVDIVRNISNRKRNEEEPKEKSQEFVLED